MTGWERPLGGDWDSSMPTMPSSAHMNRTGCITQWTSWLEFSEFMDWRPMSKSHAQWNASLEHYGQGCWRIPWRWRAQGWETRTKWDSEIGYHARSVGWNSPRFPWRYTAAACTGPSPQLTGSGCRSDRQYTNPRCTTWTFPGWQSSALAPSPDAHYPPVYGTAYALSSTGSTRGVGSGYWRITPTPYLGVSPEGAKCQRRGSVTATSHHRSVIKGRKGASGVRPYNATSRQVGSCSRSTPIPCHYWRCSHTWGRRLHSTTVIGRWYT